MRDATAEGVVISKEIKSIFQKIREIIDENQKKHRSQNTGQEEEMRESHEEPCIDRNRRRSLRAMSGDCLGYHNRRVC